MRPLAARTPGCGIAEGVLALAASVSHWLPLSHLASPTVATPQPPHICPVTQSEDCLCVAGRVVLPLWITTRRSFARAAASGRFPHPAPAAQLPQCVHAARAALDARARDSLYSRGQLSRRSRGRVGSERPSPLRRTRVCQHHWVHPCRDPVPPGRARVPLRGWCVQEERHRRQLRPAGVWGGWNVGGALLRRCAHPRPHRTKLLRWSGCRAPSLPLVVTRSASLQVASLLAQCRSRCTSRARSPRGSFRA